MPIADVQERGQRVEPQSPVCASRDDHGCEEGHEEQHEKECREQAAGPAGPEMAQVHRAGAAPLDHQKRRDQVAGKNEEGIDAVETAGEPGEPVVIRHERTELDREGLAPFPDEE